MKALLEFVAGLRPRLPTASLRTYLLIVILLAVAPIALYTSYRISVEANDRHAQMLDTLRRSAASLSQNVERELASSVDALNIVSSRITLQSGDLAQFEKTLTRRQLRPSWRSVFLTDLNGTVLFDTSEPGARRGYSIAGTLDYTKMAARPAMMVSNIVADRFAGHFTTAIAVPVIIDDVPRYVLGVWIDLPVWQDVIEKAATPARGFAGMVDRDYRVIARTISPESSIGLRATNSSVHAIGGRGAGVERMQVLEGTDSYVGWETVPTSGWTTVVGIPASARDAQIRDLIQAALIVTLGCLALGGGLAVLMARHLTLPLARLSGDTPMIGAHIPVREIAGLRDALREAHLRDAQARARLQRKADEFQTLFDSSPIGLAFAQDPECRSVIHNPAMTALVGTAEALKGGQVQVHRLGHPLAPSQLPLQRAAASGENVAPIELEIIAGDRVHHIVGQAVALREPDGRPRGAIAAVFDVTERRQAELRLTRADRQLVESQRLIDLAQDAGHVGFFHYRYASGLLTWTPGQARLFGVDNATSGDMVLDDWLRLIRRDDRAHAQKTLRRSLAAGEGTHTLEFRVDAPDGSLRWLSSRLVTHYDARQRPLETVGVTVDMTTQKLAERERAKMAERERAARLEAEAANRAKDEFLAMLSHELRNPLGAISSAAEVLKRLDPGTGVG
ncbi:MAG: PAS domain-containing protein, partial [Gammaproteobacteria bacterium]